MHTIHSVIGLPHLPVEAYREALSALTRGDLWTPEPAGSRPLVRFAEQFRAAFPAEAPHEIASLLSRNELWTDEPFHFEPPPDSAMPTFRHPQDRWLFERDLEREAEQRHELKRADAEDHVLEALMACGPDGAVAAVQLLVGMRKAIEQRILDLVWPDIQSNALIGRQGGTIDAVVTADLDADDGYARLERPLADMMRVLTREILALGISEGHARFAADELKDIARRFNRRYVDHAFRTAVLDPTARVAGADFILGLLAVAYRGRPGGVPADGFWASEAVLCRRGLGYAKPFFFRTLAPPETAALIERVVGLEDTPNLLYTTRVIPQVALPHILNLLRTSDMHARGIYLRSPELFKRHYPRWAGDGTFIYLVQELERLVDALGPAPLSISDDRPELWQLAGVVQVLAGVALALPAEAAAGELPLDEALRRDIVARLVRLEDRLQAIWPPRPPGADWEAVSRAVATVPSTQVPAGPFGWNPFSSVYRFCGVDDPAHVVRFAMSRLASSVERETVDSEKWAYLIRVNLGR